MKLNDLKLKLKNKSYVPIVVGGMGVNISTAEMALAVAKNGGIGHISDAGILSVTDQRFKTRFVKRRVQQKLLKKDVPEYDSPFDLDDLAAAQKMYVSNVMAEKKGEGAIFINCMEKLTMKDAAATLKVRLLAALDAGIDGITLSAGLHMRSFEYMKDHERFNEVNLGIIVSSMRALRIFLRYAERTERLPDYIVVEGPKAGGHLGIAIEDLEKVTLSSILKEIKEYLAKQNMDIPLIAAGGVFSGQEGVALIQEEGAAAVQVATRFAITEESGLPERVKQEYLKSREEDLLVNMSSPTGYPMRLLKQSPSLNSLIKPRCEILGYILDDNAACQYHEYYSEKKDKTPCSLEKVCLCSAMYTFRQWTCGENVYRLKETVKQNEDGSYVIPTTEEVFKDYQFD